LRPVKLTYKINHDTSPYLLFAHLAEGCPFATGNHTRWLGYKAQALSPTHCEIWASFIWVCIQMSPTGRETPFLNFFCKWQPCPLHHKLGVCSFLLPEATNYTYQFSLILCLSYSRNISCMCPLCLSLFPSNIKQCLPGTQGCAWGKQDIESRLSAFTADCIYWRPTMC
jgi:hypothetical protein